MKEILKNVGAGLLAVAALALMPFWGPPFVLYMVGKLAREYFES